MAIAGFSTELLGMCEAMKRSGNAMKREGMAGFSFGATALREDLQRNGEAREGNGENRE